MRLFDHLMCSPHEETVFFRLYLRRSWVFYGGVQVLITANLISRILQVSELVRSANLRTILGQTHLCGGVSIVMGTPIAGWLL